MHARLSQRSGSLSTVGHFLFGLTALLVSGAALFPVAHADIQQPPRARAVGERLLQRRDGPPAALPQDTVVEQGGRVEIILRAEGQVGKMIYFILRGQPQHGTLTGPPAQISRNAASVTYIHNPNDDASDDEFTFSAQATGSGVSAPETVRVRILPAPPVIEINPPELDFGAVKAGETARAEFTLENRGGSEASGHVDPPTPWVVDGPTEYHLARGARQTFRLIFQPMDERVFTNELHFQFEARNGVRLIGTGLLDPAQRAALAKAAAENNARAGINSGVASNGSIGSGGESGANGASGANGGLVGRGNPVGTGASASNSSTGRTAGTTGTAGPGGSPSASASPGPVAPGRPDIAATAPRTPRNGGTSSEPGPAGRDPSLTNNDDTSVILNDANVERVEVRGVEGSGVDLAWMPPVPVPASYRVEVRYLSIDEDEKLRIDWRPYAQSKIVARRDLVLAHLSDLPLGGFQMLRVVAVDTAGRLSAPSPMITVLMPQPTSWWHLTPLRVLLALLAVCIFLVIRRRLENRAILREIDESRLEANKEAGIAWKT